MRINADTIKYFEDLLSIAKGGKQYKSIYKGL